MIVSNFQRRSKSKRRNSNFIDDETFDEIIINFLTWKFERATNKTKRNRILLLHQLIEQKKWKKKWKIMHNSNSTFYRIIYKTNFFDRMIRDIKKNLTIFKSHYKITQSLIQLQKKKFNIVNFQNVNVDNREFAKRQNICITWKKL